MRQKKTGRRVKFELTDQTRQAVDDYLKVAGKKAGEFLFASRRGIGQCMTTRQYARLVSEWVANIGLDPKLFRHPLAPANEGDTDLPPHRQPTSRAALARPHQNRKYRQIPRHRGG
jgi:integrase